MKNRIGISVIVYTKNEQHDLPGCLQSMSWSDDIHVYDSMSTDSTIAIAKQYGATVTQRSYGENKLAFGGDESAHRNWAFKNIPFKYEWVYHTDADERVTPELVEAMRLVVSDPKGCAAFRVQRRDYFMGRWLKHVTPSPFNIRLMRRSQVRYERLTNPVTVVDGSVGEIEAHFNHYPFSKGMAHWFDKHNKYSDFEAGQIVANKISGAKFSLMAAFFAHDRNERRAQQKELYYRLPFRPLAMFILLYIVKRGFLDGKAGLTYALLRSIYEYMIVLKTNELIDKKGSDSVRK
ncbi:MAG: glycosyltransferase family 2 protein [Burkholderiaceae bacterium]